MRVKVFMYFFFFYKKSLNSINLNYNSQIIMKIEF